MSSDSDYAALQFDGKDVVGALKRNYAECAKLGLRKRTAAWEFLACLYDESGGMTKRNSMDAVSGSDYFVEGRAWIHAGCGDSVPCDRAEAMKRDSFACHHSVQASMIDGEMRAVWLACAACILLTLWAQNITNLWIKGNLPCLVARLHLADSHHVWLYGLCAF